MLLRGWRSPTLRAQRNARSVQLRSCSQLRLIAKRWDFSFAFLSAGEKIFRGARFAAAPTVWNGVLSAGRFARGTNRVALEAVPAATGSLRALGTLGGRHPQRRRNSLTKLSRSHRDRLGSAMSPHCRLLPHCGIFALPKAEGHGRTQRRVTVTASRPSPKACCRWLCCVAASLLICTRPSAAEQPVSPTPLPEVEPTPATTDPDGAPIPASTRQLVVVRAATWQSTTGTLSRFERDGGKPWRSVGDAVSINLGRHGMAWGRGLHAIPPNGPVKHERDGRSPAGVFALSYAFGSAPELPQGSKPFPYLQIRKGVACVEETRSKFYNRIVDASGEKTWQRRSEMLRPDGLFRWGVVVEQNAPDTIAGAGSCVFLHIWRGAKEPTSGCTSLAPERLEELLRWLQADRRPLLVQLPDPAYERLRESWHLPT